MKTAVGADPTGANPSLRPQPWCYQGFFLWLAQKTLADLAEQSITIEAIYATSRTPQEIIFATKLEFDIDKDLSTSKRKVFAMNMLMSQSQWARRYREQLRKDNS